MRTALLVALVTAAGWVPLVSGDTFCSATVPCAIGCCGKFNVCGLGPDYCGPDNCINNCDAKADCNPGDWPAQYVSSQTCPLNVCCSQYGFCGTTAEFCANSTITRPSCDVDSQSLPRVIGYYASGGASRACDSMAPSSFPQGVYTHVYFAFGSIDPETFEVVPATPEDEQLYPQLKALRTRDLGQQFWLSIGGWDFTDSGTPTATTFSDLAAAPITFQNVFFASLTLFMSTWGFSGVDIDWEYPGAADRNGRGEDFVNYPKFLANLKAALNEYKFGLSITLPTSYWYLQHFDLKSIEPSVDWFNYMSYDLHGTWDIGSQWTGAYLNAHTNLTEIEDTIDLLWRNNITASKVNLGLAFYGRSFTIASSTCSQPGCDYLSAGDAGECSMQAGILLGSEINNIISENNLSPVLYTDAAVKTVTWNGDQWVSFDDQETWKIKADFAKSQCLGGVLVWSVDYDDEHNTLSDGLAAALGNPLNIDNSTGLPLTISDSGSQASQSDYCQWSNCGDGCPSGFTTMVRDDEKGQIMLDATQCPTYSNQVQVLCCPTTTNIPTCRWAGFHNSGKCNAGCNSNEAEVGTVSSGCRSGYQSACCTITPSTAPYSDCQWTSRCESDNTCPSSYGTFVVGSRNGWGGRPTCESGTNYNYCCSGSVPDAFTTCQWVGHEQTNILPKYCLDACPSGSFRIAEEMIITLGSGDLPGHIEDCIWGNEAYCCSGPSQSSSTAPRGSDPFVYSDATAQEFDYLLEKYLAAPICPGAWDADFSAFTGINARSLLDIRATDNTATLAALLPMLVTWVTSQYPRNDLSEILDYRLTQNNLNGAAGLADIREAFYQNSSWSGTPLYDPQPVVSDWLCDIASSANEFGNLDAASTTLCAYVPADLTAKRHLSDILPRRITLVGDENRSANGQQPTLSYILTGIRNGDLSLHYLRWLRAQRTNQVREVILELAYWIGPEPGVAPSGSLRSEYGDSTHTAAPDRWIVFHFHIPLRFGTFQPEQSVLYPGVAAITVYHSQESVLPPAVTLHGEGPDYRAQYLLASNLNNQADSRGMQNYNARTEPLRCPDNTRWFVGNDRSTDINQFQSQNQRIPAQLAQQLNDFGVDLHRSGIFSPEYMRFLFPTLATPTLTTPTSDTINYLRIFNPEDGAFDLNWGPGPGGAPPAPVASNVP